MSDDKKMILVKNRNAGSTGYTFNDGFHRKFEYGESKKIPLDELEQLSFIPGGEYILKNCLVIEDQSALDYLNLDVEPEYFYSEDDIKDILLNGSLDQLEDTLNFAPDGVIEILKKIAVELEIPDIRKRDMIAEKTGFNVSSAININHIMAEDSEEESKPGKPERKVVIKKDSSPTRKASAPAPQKYNVVNKK